MSNISFYHLTATPLERAMPKLLEKGLASGHKTLVVTGSEHDMEHLNQMLWVYDPASFLPHGSTKDDAPEKQPILLSTEVTLLNNPSLLMTTDGRTIENPERFSRIIDIFDGKDAAAVESARARWLHYKQSGHELTYQQQTEAGGWSQKNS